MNSELFIVVTQVVPAPMTLTAAWQALKPAHLATSDQDSCDASVQAAQS